MDFFNRDCTCDKCKNCITTLLEYYTKSEFASGKFEAEAVFLRLRLKRQETEFRKREAEVIGSSCGDCRIRSRLWYSAGGSSCSSSC